MKGGNINLSQWREISEQINNLVELPIEIPSLSNAGWHEPFVVTNGRIDDAVLDYINTANVGWSKRSFPNPLRTIEKSALVRQFTELHGAFLPKETRDFQALLSLILRDGQAPLNKPAFADFLEQTLRLGEDLTKRDTSRAFASCLLLTSYALGSSVTAGNFWAQFEAWTMVCSYILCVTTRDSLEENYWRPSYDLALRSARRSLEDLVRECETRCEYVEGHPLADGYFYGARQTILTGLVAAWGLNQRRSGNPSDFGAAFFRMSIRKSFFWGESSVPYLALASLELENRCQSIEAEGLMLQMLDIVGIANQRGNRGIPDIFVSIEDALVFQHRLKGYEEGLSYAGFTYIAEPVVEYLARRWRRQGLARRWRGLTRISLMSSIPDHSWEWFRWRAENASLASRFYPEPQSWQELREGAEARDIDAIPNLLRDEPEFLSYFVLVFPHRWNVYTMRALEVAFAEQSPYCQTRKRVSKRLLP